MDRKPPIAGWRAATVAVALFAITLNFLQPIAHAALMRSGGSDAMAGLWGAFCMPVADTDQDSAPTTAKLHECCLGLAHASTLAQPSGAFVVIEPVAEAIRFTAAIDALAAVGIRDGPGQPRGPPSLA